MQSSDCAARPVEGYNSARSGLIHSHREVKILKLDFASLDAAFDLQSTADLLVVVAYYSPSLDAGFDVQTASDSLVVLHLRTTSFYVCFDSHLTTLLYICRFIS